MSLDSTVLIENVSYPITQIPITAQIPWDQGVRWPYVWPLYITLGLIGMILNALSLAVLFSKHRKHLVESSEARLLLTTLAIFDFLFCFWESIVSLVNLNSGRFVGGTSFCHAHAFFIVFLSGYSNCVLVLMSCHLYFKVSDVLEDRKLPLVPLLLGLGVYVFLSTFVLTIAPGGSHLAATGGNCVPMSVSTACYVFAGCILISSSLISFFYNSIYKSYAQLTKGDTRLSHKKRLLVRRFSLIIFSASCSNLPELALLIYEWSTHFYAPPPLENLSTSFLLLGCIANPLIYFLTNPNAWTLLQHQFGLRSLPAFSDSNSTPNGSTETSSLPPNDLPSEN